ncbi:unnamed protein product [Leptosia nina]|uniref:Uncharacterized protein n=1 Tax=Leptosia nina TaxID=320188 RepID=A0AAV1JE07_9NEOP
MSNKAIAEVIHSDIKINIFNENEKEKKFKDTKDSEEKKADGKIIAKNKGLEMKDQVVGYVEGISWHESHGINKDEDQRKHKMPIANRSTWIEHTPYGQPGGIDSPLNYDPESRNYFVKFVFIMLFIMLLLTIGFVALVLAT